MSGDQVVFVIFVFVISIYLTVFLWSNWDELKRKEKPITGPIPTLSEIVTTTLRNLTKDTSDNAFLERLKPPDGEGMPDESCGLTLPLDTSDKSD